MVAGSAQAILYADKMTTDSMRRAIDETDRRHAKQFAYNEEHGISPRTVIRGIDDSLATITKADDLDLTSDDAATEALEFATQADLEAYIANLKSNLEKTTKLRETIRDLRTRGFLFS